MARKRHLLASALALAFLTAAAPSPVVAQEAAPVAQLETITSQQDTVSDFDKNKVDVTSMRAWRQDFHQHPETAYEETRTAEKINALLQSWGLETHTGIGKTGVVGILRSADATDDSPAICLRADMDALPVTEANTNIDYASETSGKAHACGHDGHTAMLLGAAKYLAETKNFTGTVYFIFQPAEEGGAGAQAMIDDGLFDIVKCDGIYGMHAWPGLRAGQIAVAEGSITAASDRFSIRITGKGGHAAYPATNIDAISLAADIVAELHKMRDAETPADEGAVLAVTMLHGGEAYNAMPEKVEMGGTVRTFTAETQDKIEAGIKRVAQDIAKKYGATVEVTYTRGYPSVVNTHDETVNAREAATDVAGADNVVAFSRTMAGEDFAYYNNHAPGSYVALGQWNGEGAKTQLHSPNFNFNDETLETGASYWIRLVLNEMPKLKAATEAAPAQASALPTPAQPGNGP